MKKICIVTGSRAEYGLLRPLLSLVHKSKKLQLQIIVTGSHLSPEFGLTINEILNDGFQVDRKVEILLSSDSAVGVSKAIGLACIGFADSYDQLTPDIVTVLGDRYEMLSVAATAMVARIPIAHIHGGELTFGAIDDSIRHCITKMSNLHFVANHQYRKRVIQLGENPDNVYNVGGMGVDCINSIQLLSKRDLEDELKVLFAKRIFLITYHPATTSSGDSVEEIEQILSALTEFKDTTMVFTMPNADANGRKILQKIKSFCDMTPSAFLFSNLGQRKYFSCLRYVNLMIGNSSSGLLEAPSFALPVVNIGSRQEGRLKGDNVIDCSPSKLEIVNAIHHGLSPNFVDSLTSVKNPYGDGGATSRIVDVFESCNLVDLNQKTFYDI